MSAPASSPELDAELQRLAARHVEVSQISWDLAFDFSEPSLGQLDEAIGKFYPDGNALDSTLLPFGAYIGETIRHNLGGVWVQDAEAETWLQDVGGQNIKAYPFTWIRKRFSNGMEDSIAYKYGYVKSVVEKELGHPLAPVAPRPPAPLPPSSAPDPAEFTILARSPLLVFFLVSMADGKASKKEIVAFNKIVSESANHACPLLAESLQRLEGEFDELSAQLAANLQSMNPLDELQAVAFILGKSFPDQADAFKAGLMELGLKIAQASGGFLGLGRKVNKEKQAILTVIALALGCIKLEDEES